MAERTLDPAAVREDFPALSAEWALFDHAGGTAPARQVIERVTEHLSRRPYQLGATYPQSVEAREAVEAGRAAMARLCGAAPEETVIGPSTTVLLRRLAEGMRRELRAGDEVVVTTLDHQANVGPWRGLEDAGVVVREWRFRPEDCALHLEDLEPLLGPRTRVVAFCQVSNVIGTVHDARAVCDRVRAAGALSVVDAVAFAPHRRPVASRVGADFYVWSGYKVFGPHQAVMVARRALLERYAPPYHPFLEDRTKGFEPAGGAYELMSAMAGIEDYLLTLSPDLDTAYARIAATEAERVRPLLDYLAAHPRVRLLGLADADDPRRVPTVSFTVAGRRASEVVGELDRHRVALRWGHFYAWHACRDLGLLERDGVVRASLAHATAPWEVERLLTALDSVLG